MFCAIFIAKKVLKEFPSKHHILICEHYASEKMRHLYYNGRGVESTATDAQQDRRLKRE